MHHLLYLIHRRARLFTSIFSGIVIALLFPFNDRIETRILIGWNVTVWLYLFLMALLVWRATPAQVRELAEQEDPSAVVVVGLLSLAGLASVAVILLEMAAITQLPSAQRWAHYLFTGGTLLGSWLFVNTVFTFHYAHLFYRVADRARALRFPGDQPENPDFWDFLYFAFTIAVAAQTSDVSVMSGTMRKAVLAQSVLSFLFNVAIIGLSINVAAGLLRS
jgi:uncharacterized membrane protein